MNARDVGERITIDPRVLAGKPTIRGLRISVEQVLRALGRGISAEELFREYPELEPADIAACQAYAAERGHLALAVAEKAVEADKVVIAVEPNRLQRSRGPVG